MDKYDEIMYNYCPELQLLDALDWLSGQIIDYVEIPDLQEFHPSIAKSDAEIPPLDPTPEAFALDIESL